VLLSVNRFEDAASLERLILPVRKDAALLDSGISTLDLSVVHLPCRGHVMAQLVEALHYKLEGPGFDSRWCHWNFSLS